MSLKLNKYLSELRSNANRFERTDINGKEDNSFLGRNFRRFFCLTISIVLVLSLNRGFSTIFISYASTVLAILIGLFINALIFSFDKFYEKPNSNGINSMQKVWDTQSYNYSKQFAYITGYNIVLSIFTIISLSLCTLFETLMKVDIYSYHFDFKLVNLQSVGNFLFILFALVQRVLIFYWISSIMYKTLFVVSSMIKYMSVKIDRKDD